MACSSVALSFSVRSIPAFTLLATSARSCCASGVVSWRSLSIASFLRFSPSGFHRNSSSTSPTMYHIAVLIAHAFEPSPANAPVALNIVFIICGLFWYAFASFGSMLIASALASRSGNMLLSLFLI